MSHRVTGDAVDKLLSLMSGIFDKYHIRDPAVRRRTAENVLRGGKAVEWFSEKYDLQSLVSGSAMNDFMSKAVSFVQKRPEFRIAVKLSPSRQAMIAAANTDFLLTFDPAHTAAHSMAYAQRCIDTRRDFAALTHKHTRIGDVGANYLTHARSGNALVHSCMLGDNMRDLHRRTNRDTAADAEDLEDALDVCFEGAENCLAETPELLFVHSIQDIDPETIVTIFDNKDAEVGRGTFMYDPEILDSVSGYLPYLNVHYEVDEARDEVSFHFEDDSSFDYKQKLSRLRKYSRSWTLASPRTPYAYRYDLTYVSAGTARFVINRLKKDVLGQQLPEVQYRYTDQSQFMMVHSWVYDAALGAPVESARAFKRVSAKIPSDMFKFLYKFGMANDTSDPTKGLSMDNMRAMARVFNQTRRINDSVLTGSHVMGALECERVARMMYVLVVHDTAMENLIARAKTDSMLKFQRDFSSKGAAWAALEVSAFAVFYPFVLGAKAVDFMMAYLSDRMRKTASDGALTTYAEPICSYTRMGVDMVVNGSGTGQHDFVGHVYESRNVLPQVCSPLEVLDLFSDVLTLEQKGALSSMASRADPPSSLQREDRHEVFEELSESESDSVGDAVAVQVGHEVEDTDLYSAQIEYYLSVKPSTRDRKTDKETVCSTEEVKENFYLKILEFAAYSFDVGRQTIKWARDRIGETWSGKVLPPQLLALNRSHGYGIRYLDIVKGAVMGLSDADSYAAGVDPVTGKFHTIVVGRKGAHLADKTVRFLFVSDDFKIFNHFAIGTAAYKAYRAADDVPETTFALVDGVFGCGKTHEIVKSFELTDALLTPVRETSDDSAERLREKFGDDAAMVIRRRCRTMDACAMHGFPDASKGTLFIDEGLMAWPGAVNLAVLKTRPKRVLVFGDSVQIPPVDRSVTIGLLSYQKIVKWNTIEFRNISNRSPADAVEMLARFYGDDRSTKLKTQSPVLRSLSYYKATSREDNVFRMVKPGYDYLTFLRGCRGVLLSGSGFLDGKKVRSEHKRVFTTHEAQGKTMYQVVVARTNPHSAAILEDPSYIVVSFSRHLFKCVYASVVQDRVSKLVESVVACTDAQLRQRQLPPPTWMLAKVKKDRDKLEGLLA